MGLFDAQTAEDSIPAPAKPQGIGGAGGAPPSALRTVDALLVGGQGIGGAGGAPPSALRYDESIHSAAWATESVAQAELPPSASDLVQILSLTLTWSSCQQKHGSYKQEEADPFFAKHCLFFSCNEIWSPLSGDPRGKVTRRVAGLEVAGLCWLVLRAKMRISRELTRENKNGQRIQ